MKKQLLLIAFALALTTSAAWAALSKNSLDWIDRIPGLKLYSAEYERSELEKNYTFTAKSSYEAVVSGFKQKGWQVTGKITDDNAPEMPTIFLNQNSLRAKVEVDREEGAKGVFYKMEVRVEEPRK
ncbi:MAG: hypothetical protein Q4F00_04075 [bacterium]|nr:hypothetical protein [bacterium]